MNLYEITNEYQLVLNEVCNEETGEINEQAIARLDEVKESLKEKGIAIASYIENIEAEEKAIDAAIDRMERRKKQLINKSQFLINYLQSNMQRCDINEISCAYFKVKLKKCPISIEIFDEGSIPDDYKKRYVKEVISIDKIKSKEEILAGVVVPGATIKQNVRLEIR